MSAACGGKFKSFLYFSKRGFLFTLLEIDIINDEPISINWSMVSFVSLFDYGRNIRTTQLSILSIKKNLSRKICTN